MPTAARYVGLFALVFVIGYAASALWFSPTPLFGDEHALPRVLELPESLAREKLSRLGFNAEIEDREPHPVVEPGAVIWQDPPPGTVLLAGSTVKLVTSTGPAPVSVPDVIGFPVDEARTILTAAGLEAGDIERIVGPSDSGVVLATRPTAGSLRDPGAEINLVVSAGPPPPAQPADTQAADTAARDTAPADTAASRVVSDTTGSGVPAFRDWESFP